MKSPRRTSSVTPKADVQRFLERLARIPRNRIRFVNRTRRNIHQDLIDIGGWNEEVAKDVLLGLTAENFWKGPKPDDYHPNRDVWWFGCEHEGKEVFIKFGIEDFPNNPNRQTQAFIWSFHLSDPTQGEIKYPYG